MAAGQQLGSHKHQRLERLPKMSCGTRACAIAKTSFAMCMANKLTQPNGENCSLAVWVGKFNASGFAGLNDQSRPGQPRT